MINDNSTKLSNASKPMLADVVINRLGKIKGFEKINSHDVTKICNAFINGFFENNIGKITYIVAKKETVNLDKFSDSDVCFWVSRIINTPLISIYA